VGVSVHRLGHPEGRGKQAKIDISVKGQRVLDASMVELRDIWEATSFELERLQCNPICVAQEQAGMKERGSPPLKLTFTPTAPKQPIPSPLPTAPKVCVLREEGSNSDHEMAAALSLTGFEVWDATMSDMCAGRLSLDVFRGVVFVGGFSYADVCGSAKVG